MKVEYYVCDRCKAKIEDDLDARKVCGTRQIYHITSQPKDWCITLCEKCEKETIKFLNIKTFFGIVSS